MSLEQRAAYSREWAPKVEAELRVNPEYRGFHYYETRHVYGIPDEESISEADARRIAAKSIEQTYALPPLDWERVYARVYYDITQPEAPLWKFYFAVDEVEPWAFFWAEIHARSGEVSRLVKRDPKMQYDEFY